MKSKIIYILLILLLVALMVNIKSYSTEETLPQDTTSEENPIVSDTANVEDTTESEPETVTYRPPTSNGSSYVTSVSTLSTQYQSNLNLNNILSILLIAIGALLVLCSIAILIRLKNN